jgi:hypothetical protein
MLSFNSYSQKEKDCCTEACEPAANFTFNVVSGSDGCILTAMPTITIPIGDVVEFFSWVVSDECPVVAPGIISQLNSPIAPNLTPSILTGNGPWFIQLTVKYKGAGKRVCCQIIRGCDGRPCDFKFEIAKDCSNPKIVLDQPTFPGGVHQWDLNGSGFATPFNTIAPFEFRLFDINTTTQSVVVGHRVVSSTDPNVVLDGPCYKTITPTDFYNAGAWGLYIGGGFNNGTPNFCTSHNISDYIDGEFFDIGTTSFNGDNVPPPAGLPQIRANVYVTGRLTFNQSFTFSRTTLFMGPSSGLIVNGTRRLTFSDEVTAMAEPLCPAIWQGITVNQWATFESNPLSSGTGGMNNIMDAVYAVRAMPANNTITRPILRINNTNFGSNFIGILAFNGTNSVFIPGRGVNFAELDQNMFQGNGQGTSIKQPINNPAYCILELNAQGDPFPFILPPLPPQPSYCGILTRGIAFETPKSSANNFMNLTAGIVTRAGKTTITGCNFTNILRYSYANLPWNTSNPNLNFRNHGFAINCIDGIGTASRLYSISNCTFTDCESGIYCGASKFRMMVEVVGNVFNSVQKGITLISPDLESPQPDGNISSAIVSGNTVNVNRFFNGLIASNPPVNDNVMCQLVDAHGIYIGDEVAGYTNAFSAYSITSNTINVDLASSKLIGVTCGNTFQPIQRGYGIKINGSSPTPTTNEMVCNISGANFINVLRGDEAIRIEKTSAVTVEGAAITLANDAISNPLIINVRGIQIEGGNNHSILCSSILSTESGSVTHYDINVIGSHHVTYQKNGLAGGTSGFGFLGDCHNSLIRGNAFLSTPTNPMDFSLVYNGSGGANVAQVGLQTDHSNQWSGNYLGAANTGIFYGFPAPDPITGVIIFPSTSTNKWRVRPGVNAGFRYSPLPICPDILPQFLFACTGISNPPYECAMFAESDPKDVKKTLNDDMIVQGLIEGNDNTKWSSNRYLYLKLLRAPELLVGDYATFFNTQSLTALGKLSQYEVNAAEIWDINPIKWADINLKESEVSVKEAELENAAHTLQLEPTSIGATQLYDQIKVELDAKNNQIALLLQEVKLERASKSTAQIALNNAIVTNSVYEANLKATNDLFLSTFGLGLKPTEQQLGKMIAIAQQCYTDGGPAVLNARSLYAAWTGGVLLKSSNCSVEERDEQHKVENKIDNVFSVTPNPANESVVVSWTTVFDKGQIEVFDMMGRKISTTQLNSGDFQQAINTQNYASGIYLLRLTCGKGCVYTQKLNIQH